MQIISTGSIVFDTAFMLGGIPSSFPLEVFGEEDVGKTSLALGIISNLNNKNDALYIDLERTLLAQHAIHFNIDPNEINVIKPYTVEDTFSIIQDSIDNNKYKVIVVDSVAALLTKKELNTSLFETDYGQRSRIITNFLRKNIYKLYCQNILLIFINQIRSANDIDFVETTPGGSCLKNFCPLRIKLTKTASSTTPVYNMNVKIQAIRNSFSNFNLPFESRIIYGKGYDNNLGFEQLLHYYNIPKTDLHSNFNSLCSKLNLPLNLSDYNLAKSI